MAANAVAEDWIAAFNAHDLPRILAHYHEDVVLSSPIAARLTGRQRVEGKKSLAAYCELGLQRAPQLKFTLIEVLPGASSLCVRYHSNLGDRMACECMEVGPDERIVRVLCHYA